jgi:hypothetical protein
MKIMVQTTNETSVSMLAGVVFEKKTEKRKTNMLLVKEHKKEKLPALTKKARGIATPKTDKLKMNDEILQKIFVLCKTNEEGKINEAMRLLYPHIDSLFLRDQFLVIADFINSYLKIKKFPFVMDSALLLVTKKMKAYLPNRIRLVEHARLNASASKEEIQNTLQFVE